MSHGFLHGVFHVVSLYQQEGLAIIWGYLEHEPSTIMSELDASRRLSQDGRHFCLHQHLMFQSTMVNAKIWAFVSNLFRIVLAFIYSIRFRFGGAIAFGCIIVSCLESRGSGNLRIHLVEYGCIIV